MPPQQVAALRALLLDETTTALTSRDAPRGAWSRFGRDLAAVLLVSRHSRALSTDLGLGRPRSQVLLVSGRTRADMNRLISDVTGPSPHGADGSSGAAAKPRPSAAAAAGEGLSAAQAVRLWGLAENGVYARRGGGSWELTSQAAQEASWLEQAGWFGGGRLSEVVRDRPRLPEGVRDGTRLEAGGGDDVLL